MGFQSIEYKLKCTAGDEILIPMGQLESYAKDQRKSESEITQYIGVMPKVFTEPSLDKNKASAPYLHSFENLSKYDKNINGFYYIFVNGFLWREVVAVSDGLLAEIDLAKEYGKNRRLHTSVAFQDLVLPHKTIGLNCDSTSLETVSVQVAYSIVQWSWQYITSLGGLYKNDVRHLCTKSPTYCQNKGLAKKLLNERCQLIDMEQAKSEAQIVLHDAVGIALSLAAQCEHNILLAKHEIDLIQEKTHYQSASLTYQSMFNKKLHQKIIKEKYFFASKHSIEPITIKSEQHTNNSASDKFLRSGAENIDKDYLIDYLSSDILDENLNAFPKNKQILFSFLADKYKEQILNTIQDDYIPLGNVMRDFSSLEQLDYILGFQLVNQFLMLMAVDDKSIGAFRPWLDETAQEKQRLVDEKKADSLAGKFLKDALTAPHWLTDYFTAPANLYDVTVQSYTPKTESAKNDGSGLFRYQAFALVHKLISDNKKEDERTFFNHHFKAVLGAYKSIMGDISGNWLRLADRYKKSELKADTIKVRDMIIRLNKATGLPEMGTLHVIKAANVGDDVVAIMNYQRIHKNRKQRRDLIKQKTKNAGQNPVTFYDSDGNTIASQDPKQFGSNKGVFNEANWVEHNKLIGQFASLDGELVVVPKGHQYAKHMADPEFKLAPIDSIKLKGIMILDKGLPSLMLAFELYNCNRMIDKFNQGEKFDFNKFTAELVVSTYSLAASGIEVAYVFSTHIEGGVKVQGIKALKANVKFLANKRLFSVTRMTVIGMVGVGLGVLLSLSDAWQMASYNDMDAAYAHLTAAALSIAGFAYLGFALLTTPLGWAIIIAGALVTILALTLTDNALEKWAINGPFSKDAANRCTDKFESWLTNGNECYQALANELLKPQMSLSIQKLSGASHFLKVDVNLVGFTLGQSELLIEVQQTEDSPNDGIWFGGREHRVNNNNLRVTQKMTKDNSIIGFTYDFPFLAMWSKATDVSWQVKLQYRLSKDIVLPHISAQEQSTLDKDDLSEKAYIIKEIDFA
ncbi:hypothetical protein [Pseudoalteromonas denitrificans]|uniref:Uncharacterized protein n=1 Tax=Pseudoalteromonas denitrificans DSM 6059 TaxID=1123010 RepID=A0A1I1NEF0_9GAMM|nr:hypothetical protein [Pseudoalteromonas denitrificans]SFC95999.1 hypothetical protein SAMN02745724_03045 [Pseudoalteromonas denitrificans DSM 6059]